MILTSEYCKPVILYSVSIWLCLPDLCVRLLWNVFFTLVTNKCLWSSTYKPHAYPIIDQLNLFKYVFQYGLKFIVQWARFHLLLLCTQPPPNLSILWVRYSDRELRWLISVLQCQTSSRTALRQATHSWSPPEVPSLSAGGTFKTRRSKENFKNVSNSCGESWQH